MNDGILYEFDEIDADLNLVPLSARRVLDFLGAKLSLQSWNSLSLADRRRLVQLGSAAVIVELPARVILSRATPQARDVEASDDPSASRIPEEILARLDSSRPISLERWGKLTPLERYVLDKVARSKNVERLPRAYDEIVVRKPALSHLDAAGNAHLVDVGAKATTVRRAVATSTVTMSVEAHRALLEGNAPKGDVLGTARIAGIMAAKETFRLIPLCHPLHLTGIEIAFETSKEEPRVEIRAEVSAIDRTGVEMEAMTAASIAALTIYDMLKAVDRAMVIGPTRVLEKTGGKRGDYRA